MCLFLALDTGVGTDGTRRFILEKLSAAKESPLPQHQKNPAHATYRQKQNFTLYCPK